MSTWDECSISTTNIANLTQIFGILIDSWCGLICHFIVQKNIEIVFSGCKILRRQHVIANVVAAIHNLIKKLTRRYVTYRERIVGELNLLVSYLQIKSKHHTFSWINCFFFFTFSQFTLLDDFLTAAVAPPLFTSSSTSWAFLRSIFISARTNRQK